MTAARFELHPRAFRLQVTKSRPQLSPVKNSRRLANRSNPPGGSARLASSKETHPCVTFDLDAEGIVAVVGIMSWGFSLPLANGDLAPLVPNTTLSATRYREVCAKVLAAGEGKPIPSP